MDHIVYLRAAGALVGDQGQHTAGHLQCRALPIRARIVHNFFPVDDEADAGFAQFLVDAVTRDARTIHRHSQRHAVLWKGGENGCNVWDGRDQS